MLGPDQRIRQPAPNDDDRKGAARGGAQNRLTEPARGCVLLRRRLGSRSGAAALNVLSILDGRCPRERSRACGWVASPPSMRRWLRSRRITSSSRCERAKLALGGLRSAEPRLGEPWPPLGRAGEDRLGAAGGPTASPSRLECRRAHLANVSGIGSEPAALCSTSAARRAWRRSLSGSIGVHL